MIRKIFIISIIILLVLSLALFSYNYFFKEKNADFKNDFINSEKQNVKIVKILDDKVVSPFLANDKVYYVSGEKSKGFMINLDGSVEEEIFKVGVDNFTGFFWNPEKNQVIIEIQEGQWKDYHFFDYKNNNIIPYDKNITSVSWINDGNKIAYEYYDSQEGSASLSVADKNGENWEEIGKLEESGMVFETRNFNDNEKIFFWKKGLFGEMSVLKYFNSDQKSIKKLNEPREGADYLPSRDGQKTLISSLEGGAPTLGLINENKEYANLKIPTFVQKAVWSKDGRTIYYALPLKYSKDSVLLPDDYNNKKVFTADSFWRVDVESGKKERLVELDEIAGEFDASELFLSESERYLFFVNKRDKSLYRLEL